MVDICTSFKCQFLVKSRFVHFEFTFSVVFHNDKIGCSIRIQITERQQDVYISVFIKVIAPYLLIHTQITDELLCLLCSI